MTHYTQNTIYADVEAGSDWSSTLSYNEEVWDGFVYEVQQNVVNVGVYSSPDNWSDYFDSESVTQLESGQLSLPSRQLTLVLPSYDYSVSNFYERPHCGRELVRRRNRELQRHYGVAVGVGRSGL